MIDAAQFAKAFAAHASSRDGLQRICRATGLSAIQIRLYTHILNLDMPDHQWINLSRHHHTGLLAPATVQHLYHEQGMSIADIARLA